MTFDPYANPLGLYRTDGQGPCNGFFRALLWAENKVVYS